MLPDFLIIGAAKSATTWVSRCLGRHPDIYMCGSEIHYFSRFYDKPLGWYESFFETVQPDLLVGEGSNSYLYDESAPRRIAAALPDVKLISILRNPTDRAYSGYCMQFRRGSVSENIYGYLDPAAERAAGPADFLGQGLYAQHLRRYVRLFERDRIKVMLFDDLGREKAGFVDEILSFLGVRSALQPAMGADRVNARRGRDYPKPLARMLLMIENVPAGKLLLRGISRLAWSGRVAEHLRAKAIRYPPLTEELRRRLREYYRQDIMELEDLIGRDLSHWRG